MEKQDKTKQLLLWPRIWLILGLLLGSGAAATAYLNFAAASGALGGLTAVFAIVLTYVIARRQADEASELNHSVENIDQAVGDLAQATDRLYKLTLSLAERESAQDYEGNEDLVSEDHQLDANTEAESDSRLETPPAEKPPYAAEAISRLRRIGSSLTEATAMWKPKAPDPPIRGNHGWFVENVDGVSAERWYVRKGRYWNIRKAMPREFLEALETKEGVDPRTIKLDFQLKEHGLASWYARTYDGVLWRVSKPNRNQDLGVLTSRVDEDSSSD